MRMTDKLAREMVAKWLADQGKQVPRERHNYVDFVTEVRMFSGIDPREDAFDVWDRDYACLWLRTLAYRIRDNVPIGNTLLEREAIH